MREACVRSPRLLQYCILVPQQAPCKMQTILVSSYCQRPFPGGQPVMKLGAWACLIFGD